MFNLQIDKDSKTFWEGAIQNKLMIQKSKKSGVCFIYSIGHSNIIADEEYEWVESSGKGIIYSYTISHIAGGSKYYIDKVPYVIGSILLEENVRLTSSILTKDFSKIKIGKNVVVVFKKLDNNIVFPCFKLV